MTDHEWYPDLTVRQRKNAQRFYDSFRQTVQEESE